MCIVDSYRRYVFAIYFHSSELIGVRIYYAKIYNIPQNCVIKMFSKYTLVGRSNIRGNSCENRNEKILKFITLGKISPIFK